MSSPLLFGNSYFPSFIENPSYIAWPCIHPSENFYSNMVKIAEEVNSRTLPPRIFEVQNKELSIVGRNAHRIVDAIMENYLEE